MTKIKLKPIIRYYNNNIIECVYNVDKNGNKQGLYERYHENGQLDIKCTYKDGEYDGLYESYYENGQPCKKCTYKDGEYNGPEELYYENGQLYIKSIHKDGKPEGQYEVYYDNGQLKEKCSYKNGKLDGPYKMFWDNAQLCIECSYKDGKIIDGTYRLYHKSGKTVKKAVDKSGVKLRTKESKEHWKELSEKFRIPQKTRQILNARLEQINKQMSATPLRQSIKRSVVAKFRTRYQAKNAGRER